jgi:hypothetical protein
MGKIEVLTPGCREKFEDWIKNRGGVKVWRNIDLSSCGAGPIFTPATENKEVVGADVNVEGQVPYPKPSWRVDNGEVITDINRFRFVKSFKEFKRIRVALQRGSGFNFQLTDGSQRKVDRALDQAREKFDEAVYRKDGGLFDVEPLLKYERFIVVEIPEWED